MRVRLLAFLLFGSASFAAAQLAPLTSPSPILIPLHVPDAEMAFSSSPLRRVRLHVRRSPPAIFELEGVRYRGFTLELENEGRHPEPIPSVDGALRIVREARNAAGEFVPIEAQPSSHCGLSFYGMVLPPRTTWSLNVPEYGGPIRTEMRFRLDGERGPVYSETFSGNVTPGQLSPSP